MQAEIEAFRESVRSKEELILKIYDEKDGNAALGRPVALIEDGEYPCHKWLFQLLLTAWHQGAHYGNNDLLTLSKVSLSPLSLLFLKDFEGVLHDTCVA